MYYRKYSKNENRWYFFGYSVVTDYIAKKLRWNIDIELKPKLLWRYAYSQYCAGKYEQALVSFDRVQSLIDEKPELAKRIDLSLVYQYWGKTYVYLFLSNQDRVHLESAYQMFAKATQHIPTVLEATVLMRMPVLLLEIGRCLEFYGSFEESMDSYGKILASFPNFRGYFVAMFRTAVIGRHMASLATDPQAKSDAVDKCIDILLFLLESPPREVPSINLVLLYARTLELSPDTQIRFRAVSVYHSFYILCKNQKIAKADTITDEKAWNSSPDTWITIADYIEDTNEYLIAKEAFLKYVDELQKSNPLFSTTFETMNLDIPTCMKLAQRFLKYQNVPEAIKYGEIALKQDHFNKEVRSFLSKYSESYQVLFQTEKNAVNNIRGFWKFRCWSWPYIHKLKRKTIEELETLYAKRPYDLKIREQLSYYCKDKYRNLFLYQNECATIIKVWYRNKKWKYQQLMKVRKKFQLLASEYYHNFINQANANQENLTLKKNILRFLELKSNFIGKKHPLLSIGMLITKQFHSIKLIQNCFKAYKLRRSLNQRTLKKKEAQYMKYLTKIICIQKHIRRYLAFWRVKAVRFVRLRQTHAAKKIQIQWRVYLSSASRMKAIKKRHQMKIRAMNILRKKFLPYCKEYIANRGKRKKKADRKQKKFLKVVETMTEGRELVMAAMKIQRLFRHNYDKGWIMVSRQLLSQRKQIFYSAILREEMKKLTTPSIGSTLPKKSTWGMSSMYQKFIPLEEYYYHNPGTNPNSVEFQTLLQQNIVICPIERMEIVDYQFLGMILKNTFCQIHTLIIMNSQICSHLNNNVIALSTALNSSEGSNNNSNNANNYNGDVPPLHRSPSKPAPMNIEIELPSTNYYATREPVVTAISPTHKQSKLQRNNKDTKSSQRDLLHLQSLRASATATTASTMMMMPLYEFEALKQFFLSLKQCFSLRSLYLLGGKWSTTSITHLFHLIQVDNPRIQSLALENIENSKVIHGTIASATSTLLKDYFNYSIPGILFLSLHGCHLQDTDLVTISEGLKVNTSLEKLILSCNLITDEGMIDFLVNLQENKKRNLLFIDMQYNFIRCQRGLQRCLSEYRLPLPCQENQFTLIKQLLEINFQHNPILLPFDVMEFSLYSKIPPQLILYYDPDVMERQEIFLQKQKSQENREKERIKLLQQYSKEHGGISSTESSFILQRAGGTKGREKDFDDGKGLGISLGSLRSVSFSSLSPPSTSKSNSNNYAMNVSEQTRRYISTAFQLPYHAQPNNSLTTADSVHTFDGRDLDHFPLPPSSSALAQRHQQPPPFSGQMHRPAGIRSEPAVPFPSKKIASSPTAKLMAEDRNFYYETEQFLNQLKAPKSTAMVNPSSSQGNGNNGSLYIFQQERRGQSAGLLPPLSAGPPHSTSSERRKKTATPSQEPSFHQQLQQAMLSKSLKNPPKTPYSSEIALPPGMRKRPAR